MKNTTELYFSVINFHLRKFAMIKVNFTDPSNETPNTIGEVEQYLFRDLKSVYSQPMKTWY